MHTSQLSAIHWLPLAAASCLMKQTPCPCVSQVFTSKRPELDLRSVAIRQHLEKQKFKSSVLVGSRSLLGGKLRRQIQVIGYQNLQINVGSSRIFQQNRQWRHSNSSLEHTNLCLSYILG